LKPIFKSIGRHVHEFFELTRDSSVLDKTGSIYETTVAVFHYGGIYLLEELMGAVSEGSNHQRKWMEDILSTLLYAEFELQDINVIYW